jgi:hypothetical protein
LSSHIFLAGASQLFGGAGVEGGLDGLPLRLHAESVCITEACALAEYLIGACEADGVIDLIADANVDGALDAADVVMMIDLLSEFGGSD